KLWTWHKPDFSLLDGHVDHTRSEYVRTVDGVGGACRQLAARIGTGQLIWCYTVPDQRIVRPCHTEVEWVLDVPPKSILQLVDDIVWNRILGIRCTLPPKIRHAWRDEALRRFPYDAGARAGFETEQEESFWTQPPSGESWWDVLFVREEAREGVSALVPHPVEAEWIVVDPLRGP
ncbi:MAG: hypothetical protein IID37_14490, partial [Planctomycetes bacterium]|nr:hypothetical protein [Planctomycetota bacterium]